MALTESEDKLKQGDIAPDFELQGTNGLLYSLRDFDGKAKLIIFMCNHCPYVIPKLKEMNRIAKHFKDLAVIGINPNDTTNYPEDSYENMQLMVKKKKILFPYLRDDTQEVAKAYGAVCTPDPFLFDKYNKLIFHSRIDDTHGDMPVKKHEMYDAIDEFFKTGNIAAEEMISMGCSIKWKYD